MNSQAPTSRKASDPDQPETAPATQDTGASAAADDQQDSGRADAPPTGPLPLWPSEPSAGGGPGSAPPDTGPASPPAAAESTVTQPPPPTAPQSEPLSPAEVTAAAVAQSPTGHQPPGYQQSGPQEYGPQQAEQQYPEQQYPGQEHGGPQGAPTSGPPMPPPQQHEQPSVIPVGGSTRRGSLPGVEMPSDPDGPRMRQLAGAAVWALLLAIGGIMVGIWALVSMVSGSASGWFEPVIVIVGLVGLALTAAAFPMVKRRGIPWLFLGLATVTLVIGIIITSNAS